MSRPEVFPTDHYNESNDEIEEYYTQRDATHRKLKGLTNVAAIGCECCRR